MNALRLFAACVLFATAGQMQAQFVPLTVETIGIPNCDHVDDFEVVSVAGAPGHIVRICESGFKAACEDPGTGRFACIENDRFEVSFAYETVDPFTRVINGQGHGVLHRIIGGTTALFLFSEGSSESIEVFSKILNTCGIESLQEQNLDGFWHFAGGLTDVRILLVVRDASSGHVVVYENPQGEKFLPVQDVETFGDTPAQDVCSDG